MRRVNLPSGTRDILYGETPSAGSLSADRSKLVLDPEEQRLLSVVRHMYLVERLPMRGIVERLRKMGVVNRRGRPFGLSGVWEMIHRRQDRPEEAVARGRGGPPRREGPRQERRRAPRARPATEEPARSLASRICPGWPDCPRRLRSPVCSGSPLPRADDPRSMWLALSRASRAAAWDRCKSRAGHESRSDSGRGNGARIVASARTRGGTRDGSEISHQRGRRRGDDVLRYHAANRRADREEGQLLHAASTGAGAVRRRDAPHRAPPAPLLFQRAPRRTRVGVPRRQRRRALLVAILLRGGLGRRRQLAGAARREADRGRRACSGPPPPTASCTRWRCCARSTRCPTRPGRTSSPAAWSRRSARCSASGRWATPSRSSVLSRRPPASSSGMRDGSRVSVLAAERGGRRARGEGARAAATPSSRGRMAEDDAHVLAELDPLHDSALSSPIGPTEAMKPSVPAWTRFDWGIAAALGVAMGSGSATSRNAMSDEAMYRTVAAEATVSGLQGVPGAGRPARRGGARRPPAARRAAGRPRRRGRSRPSRPSRRRTRRRRSVRRSTRRSRRAMLGGARQGKEGGHDRRARRVREEVPGQRPRAGAQGGAAHALRAGARRLEEEGEGRRGDGGVRGAALRVGREERQRGVRGALPPEAVEDARRRRQEGDEEQPLPGPGCAAVEVRDGGRDARARAARGEPTSSRASQGRSRRTCCR